MPEVWGQLTLELSFSLETMSLFLQAFACQSNGANRMRWGPGTQVHETAKVALWELRVCQERAKSDRGGVLARETWEGFLETLGH